MPKEPATPAPTDETTIDGKALAIKLAAMVGVTAAAIAGTAYVVNAIKEKATKED